MSLQRCQCETSSTDFVGWQQYLAKDMSITRREEYYLAQVAAEVRRLFAKNPASIKIDHLLLPFTIEGEKKKLTKKQLDKKVENSKHFWFAIAKMGVKNPPPQKGD